MAAGLHLHFECPKTKDDFVSSGEGLFCPECQKPVLNLTGKKRPEILQTLHRYAEMPCVWIPVDVLQQNAAPKTPWWSPWRRTLLWAALFLLLADVKTLFAQTPLPEKAPDTQKPAPLGYQKITLSGTVKNTQGEPIEGAELWFSFLSQKLGQAQTGPDGSYRVDMENYGGIREIDIHVSAADHNSRSFNDIPVNKATPVFSVQLEKRPSMQEFTAVVGGIGYTFISPLYYHSLLPWGQPVDIFGHPPVRFDTQPREYLNEKLSYKAWVTDLNGNGIPGARIEMRFPDNQTREGFAGENGYLLMNMQLENAATYAHLVISAPGYHNKTVPFYEFDHEDEGGIVHKLVKKREKKPKETREAAASMP